MKLTKEQICDKIRNFDTQQLIELNNAYCDSFHYNDDWINSMDDFEDLFSSYKPFDLLQMVHSDFNINHSFFRINGYGHVESFNHFTYNDLPDSIENIAEDMIETSFQCYKHLFN